MRPLLDKEPQAIATVEKRTMFLCIGVESSLSNFINVLNILSYNAIFECMPSLACHRLISFKPPPLPPSLDLSL